MTKLNTKKLAQSLRDVHANLAKKIDQRLEGVDKDLDAMMAEFERVTQGTMALGVEDLPDIGQDASQVYQDIEQVLGKVLAIQKKLTYAQGRAGAIASHSLEGAETALSLKQNVAGLKDDAAAITDKMASLATLASGIREIISADAGDREYLLELIGEAAVADWLGERRDYAAELRDMDDKTFYETLDRLNDVVSDRLKGQ